LDIGIFAGGSFFGISSGCTFALTISGFFVSGASIFVACSFLGISRTLAGGFLCFLHRPAAAS
jgi:hypothetical protein